jgi:hypothetical protein
MPFYITLSLKLGHGFKNAGISGLKDDQVQSLVQFSFLLKVDNQTSIRFQDAIWFSF